MAGQRGEGLTVRGDASGFVQGAQKFQQLPGLGHVRGRRRGQPRERRQLALAPRRSVQCRPCEIRFEDLRDTRRGQAGLRGRAPEPVAYAWRHPPRPAAALVGHVSADAHRLQAAQGVLRVEDQPSAEAAVHDHPHTLDGQRSLGNGRGQHDLPAPGRTWRNGRPLLLRRQQTVQGINGKALLIVILGLQIVIPGLTRNLGTAITTGSVPQQFRAAPDLPLAGQERQHVAVVFPERHPHPMRHALSHIFGRGLLRRMLHLHREHPPRALDERGVQLPAERFRVDRRGHQQNTQVRTQQRLRLARQRQGHIALQAPLVKFVKNDDPDALQGRVVHQHPRQDTLGQHLDPGRRTHAALKADPVADRPADRLTQQCGHPLRNLPRGNPPRFQDNDFSVIRRLPLPVIRRLRSANLLQNRQRQHRRLAGSRGCRDYQPRRVRQRLVHGAGDLHHRQIDRNHTRKGTE